jgi:hypothetical protein
MKLLLQISPEDDRAITAPRSEQRESGRLGVSFAVLVAASVVRSHETLRRLPFEDADVDPLLRTDFSGLYGFCAAERTRYQGSPRRFCCHVRR